MNAQPNKPGYNIITNRRSEKGWKKLVESYPEAMVKCWDFLTNNPLDYSASGGKIKRLKGGLKEYMQYDVTDSARIRYWVDQENHTVNVEYAGPHP